jgi:hypothetical protein
MRNVVFFCALTALAAGLATGVAAEPRMVLIEEFTNTS